MDVNKHDIAALRSELTQVKAERNRLAGQLETLTVIETLCEQHKLANGVSGADQEHLIDRIFDLACEALSVSEPEKDPK